MKTIYSRRPFVSIYGKLHRDPIVAQNRFLFGEHLVSTRPMLSVVTAVVEEAEVEVIEAEFVEEESSEEEEESSEEEK